MNFRTQIELPEKEAEIQYSEQIMLLGSCFVDNIGDMLVQNKFRCNVNPYGVLYNPLSIAKALREMADGKKYDERDLFHAEGMWHSWMHHSDFSAETPERCLALINTRLGEASATLYSLDWLVVTWGTAYVYSLEENQEVVGNCHKQPSRKFLRKKLDVDEIVNVWQDLLEQLRELNPKMKVLFTVSPIRHAKDGLHGNQLSKSTLLLAVDKLCTCCSGCYYFPSYEIMMDELRDYRFYADDMLHPSRMAVEYIWECFCSCYLGPQTKEIMREWQEIRRGLEHRPFNPVSTAYRAFLSQIVLKINRIKEKFPYLEVQKELELCESRLNV